MLLVVAGLITKTIAAVEHVPTGIDPSHVLTLQVQLDPPKYPATRRGPASSPSSSSSACARCLASARPRSPTASRSSTRNRRSDSTFRASRSGRRRHSVGACGRCGGDYFNVFNFCILAGRTFSARDNGAAPNVAVINREAERRYWGGAAAIGSRIEMVGATATTTIARWWKSSASWKTSRRRS